MEACLAEAKLKVGEGALITGPADDCVISLGILAFGAAIDRGTGEVGGERVVVVVVVVVVVMTVVRMGRTAVGSIWVVGSDEGSDERRPCWDESESRGPRVRWVAKCSGL